MSIPRTAGMIAVYNALPQPLQEYFVHFPKLVEEFPHEVALSCLFAQIELYRSYFKTRKFSWVMTRKLSETLSRNFVHSCGMVSRMNARMALANCF